MDALINPTNLVSSFGYLAVFLLSVAQSCCVPTSSELTLGFAGALAATGHMSLPGAIVAGASGEVVGAYLAWAIGHTAGRAIVDRYGKYLLLTHRDLDRAEAWYARHGRWGVFGGRLVPVIRNFVALPAGVADVPLLPFGLLTAAGSLIWDGAMAGIGYGVGSHWNTIIHAFSDAGYVIGALAVVAIGFAVVHRWRSYGEEVRATRASSGAPRAGGGIPMAEPSGAAVALGPGGTLVETDDRAASELRTPREEITALVRRLAEPGAGVGERTGTTANERLTAAAAATLFVLLFFEGLTLVRIHSLVGIHVILGLVLIPPVLVKLASTGWRFLRYYTRHPAYLRKGPPAAVLRVLAPFLVASTVVLFASGIALVFAHNPHGWLYQLHRDDFILWFVLLSVHVLAYMWQVPGVVRRDLSAEPRSRHTSPGGRLLRLWLVSSSILAGVLMAVMLWPSFAGHMHIFAHLH